MEAEEYGSTAVAENPTKGEPPCSFVSITFWSSLGCFSAIFRSASAAVLFAYLLFAILSTPVFGLGSIATIAASYDGNGGGAFVCGIVQGNVQSIQCWNSSTSIVVKAPPSQASFRGISGGNGFFCGVRLDTGRPFCWDTHNLASPKRLKDQAFSDIVSGTSHVCALAQPSSSSTNNGSIATCWRNRGIEMGVPSQQAFTSLASGGNFVCGIKFPERTVQCWGDPVIGDPPNAMFSSLQAGLRHACGLTDTFNVMCWGDDSYNQLKYPDGKQFLSLALGNQHSCGIEAFTRSVICWGNSSTSPSTNVPFFAIAAGDVFTCGILFSNSSIMCWGASFGNGTLLPLNATVPSACTSVACEPNSFQWSSVNTSGSVCSSSQLHVCTPCLIACQTSFLQTAQCTAEHDISCQQMSAVPPVSGPPPAASSPASIVVRTRSRLSKGLIALVALGAFGSLCGLLTVGWCIWAKCRGPVGFSFDGSQGRVHNAPIGNVGVLPTLPPSRTMKRQRSSTSSVRSRGDITTGRAQAFTIADMVAATMGFSEENVIATGSFGIVYRGMLPDGREVAIKRREKETVANEKKMEERESAYQSELEFLSRLHHKHLVSLVGFCDEEDERMLVYDYMPNGTLHDHLHGSGQSRGENGGLPWQMRIKIALEAARGVEYLHTYAVPPIIHRDIKSSNILLDGGWSARVSDFGLSTRGPAENSHLSLMAAGTLGYMDPEYYRLQHLTIKSDVYSFGVVLLELLTGERAIHKQSYGPVNIVDYAVPRIVNHDLASVLDQRPGAPIVNELKALEMMAQLAAQCVRLEGKERPTMTEIVGVLEEAMAYTSNGRSRSQSSAVASLSGILPLDASIARFKHLEEATDTVSVPFEFVRVEGPPFESLEAEVHTVSIGPTESPPDVTTYTPGDAFIIPENGKRAGSSVTPERGGEDFARGETYDVRGGGDVESKTLQDVRETSNILAGTEFVETVSYSTFGGGSGDAGSSETIDALTFARSSDAMEPTQPHEG